MGCSRAPPCSKRSIVVYIGFLRQQPETSIKAQVHALEHRAFRLGYSSGDLVSDPLPSKRSGGSGASPFGNGLMALRFLPPRSIHAGVLGSLNCDQVWWRVLSQLDCVRHRRRAGMPSNSQLSNMDAVGRKMLSVPQPHLLKPMQTAFDRVRARQSSSNIGAGRISGRPG